MAVLARLNLVPQMRLDLHHQLAQESFLAQDVRLFSQIFSGVRKNYVVRGLEIKSTSALIVSIGIADSIIFSPTDNNTSFYAALANDANVTLALPPSTSNLFIEAYFETTTRAPVTTANWDPSAVSTDTPAGAEFTGPIDFEEFVDIKFRVNTTGFSADALPVARASTNTSGVTVIRDARNLFYRLGTGGANPDPNSKFGWSDDRSEPMVDGTATALGTATADNPYFYQDANGARNDKAIKSLKEWMDAVMTIIAEIKGSPYWYSKRSDDNDVSSLTFDSENGHSLIPKEDTMFQWSASGDFKLRAYGTGPVSWKSNKGQVQWNLGATFTSSTDRSFSDLLFSKTIPGGRSLLLRIEREKLPLGVAEALVKWGVEAVAGQPVSNSVKGAAGDFTGIAVGDYIRKSSEGYLRYVQVVGFFDTSYHTATGLVADSSATGLVINTAVSGSLESYRWFRANYSNTDLFYTAADGLSATNDGTNFTNVEDKNYYFIGRRNGNAFRLRGYGDMQAGAYTHLSLSRVAFSVSTNTTAPTTVNHGFLAGTKNFVFSVQDETNNRSVLVGAQHTNTGLILDPTPGGAMQLRVVFIREVS